MGQYNRQSGTAGRNQFDISNEELKEMRALQDEQLGCEIKTPNRCPACNGSFVTETLASWICADCGASKENPVSKI